MGFELKDSFFTQYALPLNPQKNNSTFAFKDHSQFPLMADILSRKHRHHVLLHLNISPDAVTHFLEAFMAFVEHEHLPQVLRKAKPVYLAIDKIVLSDAKKMSLENDIQAMMKILDQQGTHLLLILNDANFLNPNYQGSYLTRQLLSLINHERCRCIVLSKNNSAPFSIHSEFTQVHIPAESSNDAMAVLMRERIDLEHFHHVLIPEELLSHAYALADRYLGDQNTLEKALLLLDSSAARAYRVEQNDVTQFKPVLTAAALNETLSNWIHIPATHLQPNRFKTSEFISAVAQKVFGQDAAITLLAQELQQAQANLRLNTGTFCNFLFAGPRNSGKKTLAVALAEQLFMQTNMLYIAQSSGNNPGSIAELKLQSYATKNYLRLKDVVFGQPYAIIMIEDVEQMPQTLLDELQEISGSGYMHCPEGRTFNFKHVIFILTTTLGTKRLLEIGKSQVVDEESHEVDLVQLIMSEQKQPNINSYYYSPQDMADEILPEIAAYIPAGLCQTLHIIPFLPLAKGAIENIIRVNLRELGKTLELRYGIELGYAPEVIRFLTFCVTRKKDSHQPLKKALKMLYFTVEQAILSQADNKNRPNQLLLQLNEMGQMLKVEWIATSSMRQHG